MPTELVNTVTGELIEPMDADTARRLTERLRIAASNYTDAKAKVLQLVDEAKAGSAHVALGYKSWTAYLSDVLSDEPLRLARDERRELDARFEDEGLTTRASAAILGVDHKTIVNDRQDRMAGEISPAVRTTTGLDGRERTSVTAGHLKVPTGTERNHQEAELINAFASIVRTSLTPKNIATLTPKARTRLIEILETATASLKEQTND